METNTALATALVDAGITGAPAKPAAKGRAPRAAKTLPGVPPAVKIAYEAIKTAEDEAISAVKAIEGTYGTVSAAILKLAITCKEAGVGATVLDAALERVKQAAPGIAAISVGAYCANARRIFAASAEAFAAAKTAVGTTSLKALADACPRLTKPSKTTEEKKAAAEEKKAAKEAAALAAAAAAAPNTPPATAPSTPEVSTGDPLANAAQAMLALRKLSAGKKRARIILSTIEAVEELLQELKGMMAA